MQVDQIEVPNTTQKGSSTVEPNAPHYQVQQEAAFSAHTSPASLESYRRRRGRGGTENRYGLRFRLGDSTLVFRQFRRMYD